MEHEWPGNVRELKNAVEAAAVMAAGDTIELGDLETAHLERTAARRDPAPTLPADSLSVPARATPQRRRAHPDRGPAAGARTKAEAATSLGIGLRTLYSKIHEHQLEGALGPSSRSRG
jgi:DNA-binding NtrC family response regulator